MILIILRHHHKFDNNRIYYKYKSSAISCHGIMGIMGKRVQFSHVTPLLVTVSIVETREKASQSGCQYKINLQPHICAYRQSKILGLVGGRRGWNRMGSGDAVSSVCDIYAFCSVLVSNRTVEEEVGGWWGRGWGGEGLCSFPLVIADTSDSKSQHDENHNII